MVTAFSPSSVHPLTMELLLNLLWLLIATALLGVWRTQWVHQRRANRSPAIPSGMERCQPRVGACLFFAVSMSDDMHSEIVALEECSASKRDLSARAAAHPCREAGIRGAHTRLGALVPPVARLAFESARAEVRTGIALPL